MKKWIAGATLGLAFVPQQVCAQGEKLPSRSLMLGADRVFAYWTLGICSALFLALVCVWSVGLKRASQRKLAVQAKARNR